MPDMIEPGNALALIALLTLVVFHKQNKTVWMMFNLGLAVCIVLSFTFLILDKQVEWQWLKYLMSLMVVFGGIIQITNRLLRSTRTKT